MFCRSCSTCRCILDVFVGRKVISMSYSSAILKVYPLLTFIVVKESHLKYEIRQRLNSVSFQYHTGVLFNKPSKGLFNSVEKYILICYLLFN